MISYQVGKELTMIEPFGHVADKRGPTKMNLNQP